MVCRNFVEIEEDVKGVARLLTYDYRIDQSKRWSTTYGVGRVEIRAEWGELKWLEYEGVSGNHQPAESCFGNIWPSRDRREGKSEF